MTSARSISGPRTIAVALAVGFLVSGCYYPYGYPAYPSYPVVGTTYTQQEFAVPASGTAATAHSAALPPQYEYAVGSPYSSYYQTYPYPYGYPYGYPYYPYGAYPAYPAYYGYGYGYPAVSFSFGYWGGGGCCWHGGGWHGGYHGGNNWHGGGGGGHWH